VPLAILCKDYIIKPYGYDSTKSYPLLVYFYEKFSDRKHRFEQPGIHHRPCFPVYNSSGYVIFLPDIIFREGFPGQSAIDCIMPGVKMLINKGIADPDKLAIWGHSWSGYQTAYMVTQLNDFKAAVAGAPVGNMTSAYSGIRLGTGLARQFQYEKFQSRIGGTIWDSLDSYIRNSPVFFAKNMNTPLLIMHGDVDDAVPWEQSIELYLAMRRLDKNCIFLQYRNEPHWPGRYPNKVDYAVKMKEFFDHYVLGTPMPEWIRSGKEYRGR
jgi:dipeptidyl aminopeptidase/acylaminoacyl peptidase